nr:MAG TPA: hypothetical protein [Caudoviricetes sp.]
MAQIKMIDVVKMLRLQGHDVQYRKRPDGGILITKLDGQSFKLAQGNTLAREIVGVTLSEVRKEQLKEIGKTLYKKQYNPQTKQVEKITLSPAKRKKIPLTSDLKKLLRKAQRLQKKTKVDAKVTTSKVRYRLSHYGEAEAREMLTQRIRYYQGYAYSENVRWLIKRIESINYEYDFQFDFFIEWLQANFNEVKESMISKVNNIIYELEKGTIKVEVAIQYLHNLIGG